MRKLNLTFIVFALFGITFSNAQCGDIETVTVCDMTILDGDNDGTVDGIINLYDAYNALPGVTPITLSSGIWFDPDFNFALDDTNGDLYTWDLEASSEAITDYQFLLINASSGCPNDIVLAVNFVLGPFSGIAVPTINNNDVNVEICDSGSSFDLFQAFLSIPTAQTNGVWSYDGTSPNFVGILQNRFLSVNIPYVPGPPLVEEEVFELTYTVPGITPCMQSVNTKVKISVVRQVSSGIANDIIICETDLIAGNHDADIDIQGNAYLANEDIEGTWSSLIDPTNQISGPDDSIINLRQMYDDLYLNNQRFECQEFGFTYSVESRSPVCMDQASEVKFTFVEYIRPFQQTIAPPEFCAGNLSLSTFNLYSLLTFTTENGVLYDYSNNYCTSWSLVSGPSDLGLAINRGDICVISGEDDLGYTSLGTINLSNLSNAQAGTYVFEYLVSPAYNCGVNVCNPESAQVTIIVNPNNYAGEDAAGLEFCESAFTGPLDLITLLGSNGVETIYQGDMGAWFNNADGSVVTNPFDIPEIDGQEIFDFVYTTSSANGCTDRANLSFTVFEEYSSGTDTSYELCNNDSSINLFDVLEGDPNNTGTWTGPGGFTTTDSDAIFDPNISTPGFYIYTVPVNGPCQGSQSVMVVDVLQSSNAGPDTQGLVCKEDGLIDLFTLLDASADAGGIFNDVDATGALTGNTVDLSILTSGLYNFQYEVQGNPSCSSDTSIITIDVIEVTPPTIGGSTSFCVADAATLMDLEVNDASNYNWYDDNISTTSLSEDTVLVNGEDYFVAAIDANGCESARVAVMITLDPFGSSGCEDCISDGVSVNGDNLNDELGLCDLPETFPNYEISIFNRYGTKVFRGSNNTGLFNGISNVSLTLGDKLPTGVYFYIFDPKDNETEPFQGNFYLSR